MKNSYNKVKWKDKILIMHKNLKMIQVLIFKGGVIFFPLVFFSFPVEV